MDVRLKIFGTEEAVKAFEELTGENQKKVYRAGLRKAGKIILDEARKNLSAGKKTTRKRRVEKAFRMEDITDATGDSIEGVNVGNTHYMARWFEGGTKERQTKARKGRKLRKTGKMDPVHFLEQATEDKGEEAVNSIAENIRKSYDDLLKKYERNANR
jgi:HK97 gp10 family phage protein